MKYLKLFEYTRWTDEMLEDEVNKYKTRTEFKLKSNGAYIATRTRGLLDKFFRNHPNNGYSEKQKVMRYWYDDKKLQDEANKYKTRQDFQKYSSGAHSAALDRNMLDNLFKNHPNDGYLDKEEWRENSYVIYSYEFKKYNKVYVGLTNDVNRRDMEHLFNQKTELRKFCIENNLALPKYKKLEEDLTSTEAQKRESYWIEYYKNKNWEMFNIAKAGSLGGGIKKWTKKAVRKEAKKYKTRHEFQKNNSGASGAAYKFGIMDDIFKDHPNQGYSLRQSGRIWTKEKLQEEANKYKTRSEFKENKHNAYQSARKLGILDELFKDHPNRGYSLRQSGRIWTKEKLQDEANKYKTRKEFRKNKGAFYAAQKLGIMGDIFKDHPNKGFILNM